MYAPVGTLGVAEQRKQGPDVVQAELYAEMLQPVEPVDSFVSHLFLSAAAYDSAPPK